jgi:hypothetical protein
VVGRFRWCGFGLHVSVLGQVTYPDGAAFSFSLLPLPNPQLLLKGLFAAVRKCPPPFPAGPFLPKLPSEAAFGLEVPLELLAELRIPVGLSEGIGLA